MDQKVQRIPLASIDTIKNTLHAIGFAPVDGKSGEWSKTYSTSKHSISIALGKTATDCRIDYGSAIKNNAGRTSTQNLSQSESLVVLECVDRLLGQGYPPDSLVLEKQYPLGHTGGYLDVAVLQSGKPYLMVECKTWGVEFEKEKAQLFNDGGQLLSYFQQDRSTKFIALYASRLSAGSIEAKVCAVDTSFLDGDSVAELFESWDESFFEFGAFDGKPYQIQERRLTKADLVDMKQEDGGRIFNAFAEILRRHVVSDKPNAFNKIFNLFICKVQDEEKQADEPLDFQWQAGETAKTVLSRLNDLYKAGMSQYLRMEIADHSEAEIDRRLTGTVAESDRLALHTIFTELRLYKNNEFAFKEVFDEKTFHANAEIVREVVRLLHGKKLRYASKQQFLGDFFELLLNTSVKQEAGQFFTPIPIARFLIDSLPLRAMIDTKIKANDANFLPYFLDYASGSGHFLTEGMDRIDRIVRAIDGSKMRTAAKGNLRRWCAEYAWASEFVYGIEKDYRLAKTAKVSCFLNGDGEANMILGDGLDNFALSQEYTGKLLNTALSEGERDNPQFDVVAANPPYSVGACKKTIRHGEKSFTLWPRLTDASSEIECLFVERAKQVLKPGGVAGLLLPTSILSNGGIYEAARDILLRYFRIKAMAVMGSGTFMATGTSTVILFMERRENDEHVRMASLIERFCDHWLDMTVAGQENAFAHYARNVWNVDLAVFSALLRGDDTVPAHALLSSYRQAFDELTEIRTLREKNRQFKVLPAGEQAAQLETRFRVWLRGREREKMLVFFLVNGQSVVLARSPSDKNAEKAFLGYEFSNRKGSEGLKILSGTGQIETALYSETNDADPTKINTLIRQNFLGEKLTVPKALDEFVDVVPLLNLIDFNQVRFDRVIGTSVKKKAIDGQWKLEKLGDASRVAASRWPISPLGKIAVIRKGSSITKKKAIPGLYKVVAGGMKHAYTHNLSNRPANTITVSASGASAGFVNFWSEPIFASDCTTVRGENDEKTEYLFHLLKCYQTDIQATSSGAAQPHVYPKDLDALQIPEPDRSTLKQIVSECRRIEDSALAAHELATCLTANIDDAINDIYASNVPFKRLDQICDLSRGRFTHRPRNDPKFFGGEYPFIQTGDVVKAKASKVPYSQTLNELGLAVSRLFAPPVVLVTIAANIGDVALLDYFACFTDSVVGLTPGIEIHPRFLELMMRAHKKHLNEIAPQLAQKNINLEMLKPLNIPTPSPEEQKKFVSMIEAWEHAVYEAQAVIDTALTSKKMILQKYL